MILLVLTILMFVVDSSPLPRVLFLVLVLAGMLGKASLIGWNFMHLRFEHWNLVVAIVACMLLLAAFGFALMAVDAMRIGEMAPWGST